MRKIKKGYIRLYIFLGVILLFLLLNSFMSNILGTYRLFLLLLLIDFSFGKIFYFEKDKHRHLKSTMVNMLIYLIIFFIVYYLFGILIGFAKVDNYYSWYGLKKFIIPIVLTIILKEYLRYEILCKSEGNKGLVIFSNIIFVIIDISSALVVSTISYNSIFLLLALTILPSISNNILCSYLAYKVGYKVNIIYLLIITLYQYLVPIVPNPSEYLKSLIDFILPIILLSKFINYFNLEDDRQVDRDYKKVSFSSLTFPLILTIIFVYFVSGYFTYYAVTIASGSMYPKIKVGDIVIIKQKNYDYKKIKKGDIIAYKYHNLIIVHRVIRTVNKDNKYYFYTKGDANEKEDDLTIESSDIVGIVKFKIIKLGLPTIWLNESLS